MLGWFVAAPGDCLHWPWRTKLSPLDQNTPVKYHSIMHFRSNFWFPLRSSSCCAA